MDRINLKKLERNHQELALAEHSTTWILIRNAFSNNLYLNNNSKEWYSTSIKANIHNGNDRENIQFGMEKLANALTTLTLKDFFYENLPSNLIIETDQERFDLARYIYLNLELVNKHQYTNNLVKFIFTEK